MRPDRFEVVVIGAGQAGLAIGYFLARQGRRFVILEAADAVGAAWRSRWDSLVLFTPRRYDALPGLAFPGDSEGYPTRDEVIAYLNQYAARFDLPIEFNSAVSSLSHQDGAFRIEVGSRPIVADQVVVATGPFHRPRTPLVGEQLAAEVFQTHSAGYHRPSDVPEGRVLIVGGGNTGFQIAKELSATHAVQLAIGSRQTSLPQRLLGRDIFWWLTKLGVLNKTADSRMGRRIRDRDTLIGSSPRALKRRYGVTLRPRVVEASGRAITFADGSEQEFDAVIWATGYQPDHGWIDAPVLRRPWPPPPSPWRHRRPRPVLPRPGVAAHARLGAPGLGQERRRIHRLQNRSWRARKGQTHEPAQPRQPFRSRQALLNGGRGAAESHRYRRARPRRRRHHRHADRARRQADRGGRGAHARLQRLDSRPHATRAGRFRAGRERRQRCRS